MPIIDVTMVSGRTNDAKAGLVRALTQAAERAIGAPPSTVRVIIREVPPDHFAVAGVPFSQR